MGIATGSRPAGRRWYGVALGLGFLGLAMFGVGLTMGLYCSATRAVAQQPAPQAPAAPPGDSEYANRVVAYIYGNIPITREDLGEYLIARYGAEKLELLVNKKIIEHACGQKGIQVTNEEVEAALNADLKEIKVDRKTFVDNVLKQYKKTLYEWKEDVLKPKLLLTALTRDRVKVEPEDIDRAFENHYGEKVKVRIILYPPDAANERHVFQVYDQLRSNPAEFDREARAQPNAALAAKGGEIAPICHYSGNPDVERVAFSLRPGELSEVVRTGEGSLIMRCVERLPPDANMQKEAVRETLIKEIIDEKIRQTIPLVFKEMREQASPNLILPGATKTIAQIKHEVAEEIKDVRVPPKGAVPAPGNR